MDIKDYIEQIIKNGDVEHMENLSEILEDIMELLKKYDEEKYQKYKMYLYKMACGNVLNQDMAEEIVSKMRPYGMRWNLQETRDVQRQYGLDNINPIDFFVVINGAFNDYNDIFNDNIDLYVRFTNDFINDEDAKKDKVFTYFTTIPK